MKQITREGIISLGDFPQLTTAVFGSGPDGAGTLDGVAAPTWASKSGSTYTLLRSVYLTSLTLSNSSILKTNGFKIYCSSGSGVTVNTGSLIACDGNAGGAASVGTPGAAGAAFTPAPDPGSSTAGVAGATGSSGPGAPGPAGLGIAPSFGGDGGRGGFGGNTGPTQQPGGAAGMAAGSFAAFKNLSSPILAICGLIAGGRSGGGGGSGTGGGVAGTGGGGGGSGAGGGVVAIFSPAITLQNGASITAKGGAGGTGGNASGTACGGGGGGGGGGGLVTLIYQTFTNSGTVAVDGGVGGAAGAGGGGQAAGSTGSAGTAGTVLKFNISTRLFE